MAVAESWEDFLDDVEEPAEPPPTSKPAASPIKPKAAGKALAAHDQPLADPAAERLRLKKIMEENEKRLVDDLFADCERPKGAATLSAEVEQRAAIAAKAAKALAANTGDPLEAFQLKTYRDCERLAEALSTKILESTARSPAWLRFLDLLLKECSPRMDVKDLRTLQGKLNSTIEDKVKAERLLSEKKKKPNDLASQCRNYKDELDVVYGGDSEEEEEDDIDDDDFI